MYCFYDECAKKKFFSDTGDDCIVQRVKAMQLELEIILKHHLGNLTLNALNYESFSLST